MTLRLSLEGVHALVMGADKPVAAAIALALAEAGADVACTSTNGDPEEAFSLRSLRKKIEALGRQAIADIADLGNGSSVQIAVRQIAKQMGAIDLLVIAPQDQALKRVDRTSDSDWSRTLGLNLDAYFYACRSAGREMAGKEEGLKGRIIAVLPGVASQADASALIAARAGAEAFISALAEEWASEGIVVTAIALPPEPDESVTDRAIAETLRLATSFEPGEIVRVS
jgi:2-deoxy-D-gluconate 3-dehydrogenase